jgi:probable rRNA maturation factor
MDPSSRSPAPAGIRAPGIRARDISVVVTEPAWRRAVPQAEAISRRAAAAAGGAGCVVLASDRAVRRLNARFRGRDKPTNVLTFEAPSGGDAPGGDIVLALGTVVREARQAGRRPAAHLAHLVVHGALHLRGHDHHHPGDAGRMERAEARLLHRLGVGNPWKPGAARAGLT